MKETPPAHCKSKYRVRVRFGETDLMGIVHHGTYISYFEVGRVEYMRRRGLDYHSWTELGIHLPVVEAYVRYRRTARFDELLCIETRLSELSRVKVRFDYRLLREPEGELAGTPQTPDEQLVAEGHTLLACVDQHHIPRRIPPEAEAVLLGPELDIPARIGADGRPRHAVAQGHAADDSGPPGERVAGSKS
ncbi:MAG TPA: thioesterase family protein [Polyangiaceae bacterium]|nr:thioesterase family protein [Polyangiaceae bacterium]